MKNTLLAILIDDIKFCRGNTKGKIFILNFRISNYFTQNTFLKIIGFPIRIYYKLLFNYFFCIDIADTTVIGVGFNVYHGQGLIISANTVIGNNVIVRQNTTIGNVSLDGGSPVIGNNVEIGANSVVIGEITIGNNVIIGAGSVVVKDIPPFSVVVGNPARVIKKLNET